ncbi:MAG: hypothetical protein HYU66_07150 [Armatimonadetes bacterium]|nr:hypothetical protein [Armatimonadota bacterium]
MLRRAASPAAGLVLLLAFARAGSAQISITSTGGWTRVVTAADLQAGAGSDLNGTYESATNAVILAISNTTGNGDAWRVDARRTDTTWHASFTLYLKRTNNGGGGGSISGGTAYQAVNAVDNSFFSGTGDRSNVRVQFEITGVSIQIPPNAYSTTVTFTVVDT